MTQTPHSLDELTIAATGALRQGDPARARGYFEQVLSQRPADLGAAFGLAVACGGMGDAPGQLQALDQVLAADPGHLPALLM